MTRIAGVPAELARLSNVLVEAGVELSVEAVTVSNTTLPEMPPGVAGQVAGNLADASSALRRSALIAQREAVDVRKRALWLVRADGGDTSAIAALIGFRAVGEIPLASLDTAARLRVADMLKAWQRYDRVVVPIVDQYGTESMAATKIWLLWQRRNPMPLSRLNSVIASAGDAAAYERATGIPLAGLRSVAGKIMGPIGFGTNLYSFVRPEHAHGWERTGDRIAAGAGMVGSGGATAMALAPALAAVPGLDIAVGALLVGAAGWEVYTHRKEIAHALVGGAKTAWDNKAYFMAGPGGAPAVFAWNHRGEAARVAVSSAVWGAHRAEDAARIALGVANQGLDAAEHVGGGAIHVAGGAGSTVAHGLADGWKKLSPWP